MQVLYIDILQAVRFCFHQKLLMFLLSDISDTSVGGALGIVISESADRSLSVGPVPEMYIMLFLIFIRKSFLA